jgi:CubicO group peptidase (beta-lactamase class C family)
MEKRILSILIVLTMLFAISCEKDDTQLTIEEEINEIMEDNSVPGMSALIIKDDKIAWMKSFGYANYETKTPFTNTTCIMLASVSKVFTGIALMQLYEDGHFQLDDDINNYLPFQVKIPYYESYPITFRMLLTHTASIEDNEDTMDGFYNWNGDPQITLQNCVTEYFSTSGQYYNSTDNFFDEEPGTFYEYSNMGNALEGYLIEHISGKPFNEYCNSNIFNKLNMNQTRWFLSEYTDNSVIANPHTDYEPISNYGFADYPDGMLHSNITDLANFALTILQDGNFNGNNILSAANLKSMFIVQNSSLSSSQGLQFYKETFNVESGKISLWGHSGGEKGIATEMYFDFDKNICVIVLANGDNEIASVVGELYDYSLNL